jgi:prepilin-type processing-associated H-X9-DG protein
LERGAEGQRKFDRSQGALGPYLKGKGVEICPALDYSFSKFKLKATGSAYGYGYNLNLSEPATQPAFSMSQINNPSLTGVFGDAAQVNTFQPPASPENPMLEEFYYISEKEPTTHFRHASRCNVVFADVHTGAARMAGGSLDERLPSAKVGKLDATYLVP